MNKDEVLAKAQEILTDEFYMALDAESIKKETFVELSSLLENAFKADCTSELVAMCEEKRDSITCLYLVGFINLKNKRLDSSALSTLLEKLKIAQREDLVKYICAEVLAIDENNLMALNILCDYEEAEGGGTSERKWDLYERIVKSDFLEAAKAQALAEHYKELGNTEKAIEFYKKAIMRYVLRNSPDNIEAVILSEGSSRSKVEKANLDAVKKIWTILVDLSGDETEFFNMVRHSVESTFGADRTSSLLQDQYNYYSLNGNWDEAIVTLKAMLQIDEKLREARNWLVECFKKKYANHSHLMEYIKDSGLDQEYRNVFEALADFERHIAFDEGCFVRHHTWGVGYIGKVKEDVLKINFGKAIGIKSLSLEMARQALEPLDEGHILVRKAKAKSREELAKWMLGNKKEALQCLIESFGNKADLKRIKAEVVPSILSTAEWTIWHTAAKKILETDPIFAVDSENISMYTVHKNANIKKEEKLSNEFKAQKQFFARADILMKYFNDDDSDLASEIFLEMAGYFAGFLKTLEMTGKEEKQHLSSLLTMNEQIVASFLIVKRICTRVPQYPVPTKCTFADIYEKIKDPKAMYDLLKDTKNTRLRADFLECVHTLPKWADEYLKLFPKVLNKKMITELLGAGRAKEVEQFVVSCFANPKEYRASIVYFFKECSKDEWVVNAPVTMEARLISLIQIIEITFREIENHINTTDNKKLNSAATSLLFDSGLLLNFIKEKGRPMAVKMYTMLDDISALSPDKKTKLRNNLLEEYPDMKFHVSEEKKATSRGMLVTAKCLKEKSDLLEKLQKVDLPQNAKEIEEAREKGDLKENAEYKAAKEHQHKLNADVARLTSEIARAKVFDPTTVTTSFIGFSTIATLHNEDKNKDEVYTILGPWESDPDHGIISYMAPFGNKILDAKVGEKLHFTINDYEYNYTVKSIKVATY